MVNDLVDCVLIEYTDDGLLAVHYTHATAVFTASFVLRLARIL